MDHKRDPLDRRLRLGGGGQLGASSPLFVGRCICIPIWNCSATSPDLAAHVNYEVAKIWEDATDLARSDLLHSVGGNNLPNAHRRQDQGPVQQEPVPRRYPQLQRGHCQLLLVVFVNVCLVAVSHVR